MAGAKRKSSRVERILDEIFECPPVNQSELTERLRKVSKTALREAAVSHLENGDLEERDARVTADILALIGLEEARSRIVAVVLDRTRLIEDRRVCMDLLLFDDPAKTAELELDLSPEEFLELSDSPCIQLIDQMVSDPLAFDMLANTLENAPDEGVAAVLLERIEYQRAQSGIPASVLYEAALDRPALSGLREMMLEGLVFDGDLPALRVLERLRARTRDAELSRALQGALLKIRTNQIEQPVRERRFPGEAYLGTCDGQGAFPLVAAFENDDGSLNMASLAIRVSQGVRDGFVLYKISPEQFEEVVDEIEMGSGSAVTEISTALASGVVRNALVLNEKLDQPLARDAAVAVDLVIRVSPYEELELKPLPASKFTLTQVRSLLSTPMYDACWFFDKGDLRGCGVELPKRGESKLDWVKAAAPKMKAKDVRERVLGMIRHTAQWHELKGQGDKASLTAAMYEEARQHLATSRLLRVLLEHSYDIMVEDETTREQISELRPPVYDPFVGPDERWHVKERYFSRTSHPLGRDLASLDMTEIAMRESFHAIDRLPGSRRPAEAKASEIARVAAKAFTEITFTNILKNKDKQDTRESIEKAIEEVSNLKREERALVSEHLWNSLNRFVENICTDCIVQCWRSPDADCSQYFFSATHPAQLC